MRKQQRCPPPAIEFIFQSETLSRFAFLYRDIYLYSCFILCTIAHNVGNNAAAISSLSKRLG